MASWYVDFAVDIHSRWWLAATTTPAEAGNLENVRHSVGTAFRRSGLIKEKIMKLGFVVSAVMAGSAAAMIGLAPIALADSTVQSPGNTQIVVSPGPSAANAATLQQPFGGDSVALLFHNH